MGRVEGKVAFITGVARGQGRSHALRLAEEGANIIGVDICEDIDSVRCPMATPQDLAFTVSEVEARGRSIVASEADVRDIDALQAAFDIGLAEFGHIDIVIANAGVGIFAAAWDLTEIEWHTTLDINLTGVWHTARVAMPRMREQGTGGSIIVTGSVSSLKGGRNNVPYVAAKHGLVGLVRSLALELAADRIRVNAVHPTNCNTDMITNPAVLKLFRPDLENPTPEDCLDAFASHNAWDHSWLEPIDVSQAVLWLASDEARYVTGIQLPVDLGATIT